MAETKVIMPQMGESIFEGTLTRWLKKPGDRVQRDEPLFEISTDKIDSEIPAPASGTLQRVLVQEGQTVEINTVVGIIGDEQPAEGTTAAAPAAPKAVAPTPPVSTPVKEEPAEEEEAEPGHFSPLVRRMAREHGVNLAELAGKGTGINGRVTKNDILAYIDRRRTATPQDVERVPMSPMRKAIADHMVMSQRTSAHATTVFEVDCSSIMAAREKLKSDFERAGIKLTVTPFFVLAAVRALKKFPVLNASLEGDTIVYKKTINVGIAVNIEGGLVVPIVKNAAEKNLQQLSQAINDLGERARTKRLNPEDVQGGTFSITNPGQYGALLGTPIINQPQVAILYMGGIKKRPVVIDDAIVARPMIMLALSFDHRIIDGAVADQFMADIQKQLEDWQASRD